MSKPKEPRIEIVDLKTDEVIHTVKLNSTDERHVEKVMRGLMMKMDTERFYAREVDL